MENKIKIILIELKPGMVSKNYISWMNTKEIMKFTEQRFSNHTERKVKKFVSLKKNSKDEFLFGIFLILEKNKIHIGNIKLGPINFIHKTAEISYFIGDKNYHNKGIGSLAIRDILIIAKKRFGLKKITAGVYSNNISSTKVLLKNKFKLEGTLKKQYQYKKTRVNGLIYGKYL
tara:strand:- start:590 stop:1111 length:522 start_codon:yes stop_codon:yes gene_type:complete